MSKYKFGDVNSEEDDLNSPLNILKQRYGQMKNQPVTQEEQDRAAELQRLGALLQGLHSGAAKMANVEAPKTNFGAFGDIAQNQIANKQKAYESEMRLNQDLFNQDRQGVMDEQKLALGALQQQALQKDLAMKPESQAAKDARELALFEKKQAIESKYKKETKPTPSLFSDPEAVRIHIETLNKQKALSGSNPAAVADIDKQINDATKRQQLENTLRFYSQNLEVNPNDTKSKQNKAVIERQLNAMGPALTLERVKSINDIVSRENKPEKALTEGQANSAAFAMRAIAADKDLQTNTFNNTDISSYVGEVLPNFAKSGARQSFENSRDLFTRAVLRKESGALISPLEQKEADDLYFPRPGDAPELVAQKARNRQLAIKGLQEGAAPGSIVKVETKVINGKQYRKVPGGWEVVE